MTLHEAPFPRLRGYYHQALGWLEALPGWAQTALRVLVVLALGYALLRILKGRLEAALRRAPHVDETVRIFLVRLAHGGMWVGLVAVALATLGVDLTALAGGLAIGGFVIGFALKDTLGNLASGVMLLLYRPFNVGDIVTVNGNTGKVVELGIALTTLQQFDGRLVTLPNGGVLGNAILNWTRNPTRRAEVKIGIAYSDDVDAAIKAILEALGREPHVLQDPKPEVVVTALADSSVELEVRAWARVADFGLLVNGLRPLAKRAVEQAGCTIPFPQRDVHLRQVPP